MTSGASVWVAAVDVFLSIKIRSEQLISQGTSNGLAAATDFEEAALRATLELVERDAMIAAWLTGTPGQPIEFDDTLDESLRIVLEGIERLGASVEIYSLPTSVCGTTVLCLALGDGGRFPGVALGLGADLDAKLALRQAILELGQTSPYLKRMMRTRGLTVPDKSDCVREMLDHAAYYFPTERAKAFDRLRGAESPLRLSDLQGGAERSLACCASKLDKAGVRVALIDVTSPDVATGPFRVVRAVSPDLQPVNGEFVLMQPLVFGINRDSVCANDSI